MGTSTQDAQDNRARDKSQKSPAREAHLKKRVPKGLRNRFRPWFITWLMIMWIILVGEISWGNIVAGLIVGTLVVYLLPLPAMPVTGLHVSWHKLAWFLVVFVVELLRASLHVAFLALRPKELPKTAIVTAPMRVSSEFILVIAVTLYNLQPGGAVTDIDIANRTLTIHLLDADNDERIEQELERVKILEARMIEIFERT